MGVVALGVHTVIPHGLRRRRLDIDLGWRLDDYRWGGIAIPIGKRIGC